MKQGFEGPSGTPPTASTPGIRGGCRTAASKAMLTPADQPMTTARSTP